MPVLGPIVVGCLPTDSHQRPLAVGVSGGDCLRDGTLDGADGGQLRLAFFLNDTARRATREFAMVEGVEVGDPDSPDVEIVQFLREIPIDPFTGRADWGQRSYQDDWDSTSWGGENVYDVYSLSEIRALDGTYYKDW